MPIVEQYEKYLINEFGIDSKEMRFFKTLERDIEDRDVLLAVAEDLLSGISVDICRTWVRNSINYCLI